MKTLDTQAVKENLPKILQFIGHELDGINCSQKARIQLETAVEEIFVNISSYAYDTGTGPAQIRVETVREPAAVIISFIDNGIPYDPLKSYAPDKNASLSDRTKGGLGILLVRKTMTEISYEYKDGSNILTIKKEVE